MKKLYFSNQTLKQPDWPILGPEQIDLSECIKRVDKTTEAILLLIAAARKSEIRVLAITLINALADQAKTCCRSGGLWKGCLQKLVNKLHYWKILGVPADPMWDD